MRLRPSLFPVFFALTAGGSASAQVKASEPARVSQTIDGTTLTLEYSRPRVRGRDSLFGGVVKWQEVWTPGANWATTLEVSRNIRLDGHPIAKGKYSVWLVVRPSGPWTLVLDPRFHRFHTEHPDSTAEQVRFETVPREAPFLEVLTWSFPDLRVSGGTLEMQWGTTRVSFRVDVEPSYQLATPAAKAGPYLGKYDFAWTQGGDSAKPSTFTVSYRNGSLMGEWNPEPWPDTGPVVLIPIAEHWFIPGFTQNGELYDVERDMVIEFALENGKAIGFDVRSESDTVMATGRRRQGGE